MRSAWECETQQGPLNVLFWPSVSIPPLWLTFLISGESYIYSLLRTTSSVHSAAVTQSYDTLFLTASSSSSWATSSPFSVSSWERVSWTFFRLSLGLFYDYVPWLLEMFSNCPLNVFGHLSRGPASHLAITRTIGSEWTRAWWLSLLELACFERLWPPLTRSSLPSDCPENYLIWVDSIRTVPIGLLQKSPLSVF